MKKILVAVGIIVLSAVSTFAVILTNPSTTTTVIRPGASVGPESTSDYSCYNGVCTHYRRMSFQQGTTTVCAMRTPSATSTLKVGTVDVKVGTSSVLFVEIARNTTQYATTTLIGTAYKIPSGNKGTIVASTSPAAGDAILFPPNQWFVVRAAADVTAGVLNASGTCNAEFLTVL